MDPVAGEISVTELSTMLTELSTNFSTEILTEVVIKLPTSEIYSLVKQGFTFEDLSEKIRTMNPENFVVDGN